MTDDQQKKYIDALLVERAGYQRRDLADRLAAVEAELKRVGYKDPEQPKQRQSRPQRHASRVPVPPPERGMGATIADISE